MQNKVKVTQADRILVADILDEVSNLLSHNGIGQVADLIRDGEFDEHTCIDIAARHRHQAEQRGGEVVAFQSGVDQWMDACFGDTIKADKVERCDRFIEEALEFVQAIGYSAERAHALVDYVFGRDIGEVNQEVGGVMVTLAAACNTVGVDIGAAAQAELARVWTKVEAIRAKQAAKPTGSALPIAHPTPKVDAMREALVRIQNEGDARSNAIATAALGETA